MSISLIPLLALVAAGSAAGGAARFLVSGLVARSIGETFPWGTMAVNVTGSFAIGVIPAVAGHLAPFAGPAAWPVLATGFLGSYTTVSSFSLQTLTLARDGQHLRALANIVLSLLLCLGAAAGGIALGLALSAGATP